MVYQKSKKKSCQSEPTILKALLPEKIFLPRIDILFTEDKTSQE